MYFTDSSFQLFDPAGQAFQLFALLETWFPGLFAGGIGRFLAGCLRRSFRLDRQLGRLLSQVIVVAAFILLHSPVVFDHQRAGDDIVEKRSIVTDQQHGALILDQK